MGCASTALLIALACLAQTPDASPSPAPSAAPEPTASAWYDAAYDRWKGLPLAPFSAFDIDVASTVKGKRMERRYHEFLRARDGTCLDIGVAIDPNDRPDRDTVSKRCIGPDFAFDFVARGSGGSGLPIEVASAAPVPEESGAPKTIAVTRVRSRPYAVTIVGFETVDGIDTVHLKLVPYSAPDRHIVRDLWIDRTTFGVVRLGGEARAAAGLAHATFEARYAETATSQELLLVTGYVKAQLALFKIGADFRFAQSNVTFPGTLPDWYWDQRAYDEHARTTHP